MDDLYQDEKATAQQQRDAAEAYEGRLCGAVRKLADTSDGTEFLRWLVTLCGTFRAETRPQDLATAAWNAGQRKLGVQIIALARKAGVLEHILREEAEHE